MRRAVVIRMRRTPRSKTNPSCRQIGLGSTSSAISGCALRYVDLYRPRRCLLRYPSSFLTTASPAPSVLPTGAASVPPCVPAPSKPAPIVAAPAPAPSPQLLAPRICTSPAPRAPVLFHEESPLSPYPCTPLDELDDIVKLKLCRR
jgi:hypothetical protein